MFQSTTSCLSIGGSQSIFRIESCIFQFSGGSSLAVMNINNCIECDMICCLFDRCDGYVNYYAPYEPYGIKYGSSNITCEACCGKDSMIYASVFGASDFMTKYHNNNSYMKTVQYQCTFSMMRVPQNREDVVCFNQAIGCSGDHGLAPHSDHSSILFGLNLLNNTISPNTGFFRVHYQTDCRIRKMVFVTRQSTYVLHTNSHSNSSLKIEDSFIVGTLIPNRYNCQLISCKKTTNPSTNYVINNAKCLLRTSIFTSNYELNLLVLLLPHCIAF